MGDKKNWNGFEIVQTDAGCGKGSGRASVALFLWLAVGVAHAAPSGGQVVSGSGNIARSGSTTTITQSSQNLSLKWTGFNVAPQETVSFVQPSASAIAVNRISDLNGSQILGHLNANGQVYLINPNGILFGPGAQVSVGGLVASTLDLNDSSLNGNTRSFSGNGSGAVINQGTITANGGYAALLGNHVSNQGIITAQLGTVALGAGSAVTLTFSGNNLLSLQVDQNVLSSLAENGGLIRADGGQVIMTAGARDAVMSSMVNNTGVIEARTVENHGGTITLLGGMTAGSVNVAGTLDASAPDGGNGGAIDTSAAHVNVANGAVITTASAQGAAGTWTIDPTDFTIAASGGDISGAQLGTSLGLGNVTILSTSGASGTSGNVNVNDVVGWSANTLTLNAQNNININANLNGSGAAKLALKYGQGALAAGNLSTYNIASGVVVNLPAGANFSTLLGSNGAVVNYTVITSLGAAGSTTGTDLQGMNGNLNVNYALGANIDASATSGWNSGAGFTPVGRTLNGNFDGLGHTISNLTINLPAATDSVGLFVETNGAVKNVTLTGENITGKNNVGGIVGQTNTGSSITNSSTSGTILATNSSGGGLVGNNNATITNSNSSANVTTTGDTVGGLLGRSGNATITNSYASGNVSGTNGNVGGLIGNLISGTVNNSYAINGTITSGSNSAGGLVGSNNATINDSYSANTVTNSATGHDYFGGLVGYNQGAINNSYSTSSVSNSGGDSTGGLVGVNNNGATVSNSYSSGTVTGATNVGGLVGGVGSGTTTNSFWDTTHSGVATSAGGVGMTTAQMQTQADFTSATGANGGVNPGWNFSSVWTIYNGYTYPLLQAFMTPLTVTANNATTTYSKTAYSGGNGVSYSSAPNLSNLFNTTTFTGSSQGAINAGTYVLTPGLYSNQQGYIITTVNGSLTINPLALTGSISTGSSTYGSSLSPGTATFTNVIAGDNVGTATVAVNTTGLTSTSGNLTAGTHNGIESISGLSGADAGNYTFTGITGNYTVSPLSLSVVGQSAGNKVYDGTNVATLTGGSLTGMIAGDAVAIALASSGTFATQHAGNGIAVTGADTLSGNDAGNYVLTQPALTANITPAPLTASAAIGGNTAKVYDGTTVASGATVSGSVSGGISGDVINFNGSGVSLNYNSSHVASASTIGATGAAGFTIGSSTDGSLSSDYSFTQPTIAAVAGTITPAPLTATASIGGNTTKVYDGGTAATGATVSGSVSGAIAGDVVSLNSSGVSLNYNSSHVANANTIGATGSTGFTIGSSTDGSLSSDYSFTQPTIAAVAGTISPAPLTATASIGGSSTKTYDGTTTATGASVSGGISGAIVGDVISFDSSGIALNYNSSHVANASTISASGTAGFTIGSSTDGSLSSDYSLTQPAIAAVAGTITPAPLTATASIGGTATKVYDGSTAATGASVSGGVSGAIVGDVISFNSSGLALNYNSSHVANASTISASGTAGFTIGSSTDGSLSSDYSLTQPTIAAVAGTITPAPLTVTASIGGNTTKVYDGGTAATGASVSGNVSGAIAGDVVSLDASGIALNYNSSHVANANTISASGLAGLTIGSSTDGSLSSDYSFTQPSVAAVAGTITPAPLTVTASIGGNTTKTYDGTTAATGASVTSSVSGAISGDLVSLNSSGVSLNYNSSHVASANTISATGSTGFTIASSTDGSLSSDYSFTQPTIAAVAGTITPAPLTATANIGGNTTKPYDGTTTATGASVSGGVSGAISGDVLSLNSSGIALNYNSSQAANANTISASGLAGFTIGSSAAGSLSSDYSFMQPAIAAVAGSITPAPSTSPAPTPTASTTTLVDSLMRQEPYLPYLSVSSSDNQPAMVTPLPVKSTAQGSGCESLPQPSATPASLNVSAGGGRAQAHGETLSTASRLTCPK
jgi:filamentous hemagglutinin family protein